MTDIAQQLKESRWIAKGFLSVTDKRKETLCFVALMSWALAAPLAPLFLEHYYTYMISATITSVVIAYLVCAGLLQRAAHLKQSQGSLREHFFTHPWHFFLAGMGIWSILSFLFAAEDKLRALKGGVNLREGLTAYCFYAMLYAAAVLLKEEKKRRTVQLTMLFGSVVLAAVFWLAELGFTHYRYGWLGDWVFIIARQRASIYLNSNYYGYYLTVVLVLAACYYIAAEKRWLRYTALLLFAGNAITLVVNDTLGAYLAVLTSLILIPILFGVRNGFRVRYLVPVVAFFGITVWVNFGLSWNDSEIIAGSALRNYMSLRADIANILAGSDAAGSAGSGRWKLWTVAWEVMLDKPVFGCGPEQMVFYMQEAVSVPYAWPHNEYLQYAAALGIPAGVLYLAAIISLAFARIKRVKLIKTTTLIAGCVAFGYAVSAFFGGTTYVTAPYMFLALGMTSLRE